LSEVVSNDGLFKIKRSRHTLELDELPTLINAIVGLLTKASKAAGIIATKDLKRIATEIPPIAVDIYEDLIKIKKEIED